MKKFSLILALLPFLCNGQEYKAAILFEATGNVKSIEYQTRDKSRLLEHTVFTPEGKFAKNYSYKYNENGYPIEFVANWTKKNGKNVYDAKTIIEYNEQNKPKYIDAYSKAFKRCSIHTTASMNYGEDGNVATKSGQLVLKTDTTNFEYKYEHYTFDSKGNWITRAVTYKTTSKKEGIKSETYIESRKIEYYE